MATPYAIPTIVCVNAKNLRQRSSYYNGPDPLQKWLAQPNHVYIGRNVVYVGVPKSDWCNPYKPKQFGGDMDFCLWWYEEHVRTSGLYERLHELSGKCLGCWCVDDDKPDGTQKRCHGDILVKMYIQAMGVRG